jgi:imidazolonepropionase-like amidohydrolase
LENKAMSSTHTPLLALAAVLFASCSTPPPEPVEGLKAFVGATAFDGHHDDLIDDAVLVVRDGRIEAFGSAENVAVPAGAEQIDLDGKFITPGWILGHGHLGGSQGLETGPEVYTRKNLSDQLGLYARYGVTTVLSLGGDGPEAVRLRDEQSSPDLDRARVFVAGAVVVGDTPEEARAMVGLIEEDVAGSLSRRH